MKRGKRMGWISIKYGTSRRYPGISPWSPSLIAYCVPPNTMRPCFTSCNAMARRRWMVRQEVGVATPRRKRCGPWRRSLPRGSPKVRRCKMSWNPSWPYLPTEAQRSAFPGHGCAWLGAFQAKGGETYCLSLIEILSFYSFWHWFHSMLYVNEHYFWTLGL